MVKAVVFDLDDTLYYELEYVYEGFKEVTNYLSYTYSLNFNLILDRMKKILVEKGRGSVFDEICMENELDCNILKLVDIYRSCIPKLELYEDSKFILEKLKKKNIKIGIITDGDKNVQNLKLKALGLDKYCDKIIITDEYGKEFWKPNTRSYIDMINYFNIKANEMIYVGDNPTKDFIGCKKVGIKTVRIIRELGDHITKRMDSKYEADIEIKNLFQLEEIMEQEDNNEKNIVYSSS